MSIGAAAFAGLTIVTYRPTDHTTPSVTIGGIYVRSTAMWPKTINTRWNKDSSVKGTYSHLWEREELQQRHSQWGRDQRRRQTDRPTTWRRRWHDESHEQTVQAASDWTRQRQKQPLYSNYTGQRVLAGTTSEETKDFLAAKFYCPHALADRN